MDQHHWVDITCRPRMTAYVCDPSYDVRGSHVLRLATDAYGLTEEDVHLYVNGRVHAFIKM